MTNNKDQYKEREQDLLKQIDLCHTYKLRLQTTLRNLEEQYYTGQTNKQEYDQMITKFLQGKQPDEWYNLYDDHIAQAERALIDCRKKINEQEATTKKDISPVKWLTILFVMVVLLGIIMYVRFPLTGFLGLDNTEYYLVAEDGSSIDGSRWLKINGERVYERCLMVITPSDFDAVSIAAKVTTAVEKRGLTLSLYTHNYEENEPGKLVDACKVRDYDNIQKSCVIKNVQQTKGKYWACAGSLSGTKEQTQYTIAYQTGDNKDRACINYIANYFWCFKFISSLLRHY